MARHLLSHSAVAYIAPFAVFLAVLALVLRVSLPPVVGQTIGLLVPAAALWFCSRGVIDFKVVRPWATVGIGVGVFLLWIAPDYFFPGYRRHWLFENMFTGSARTSLSPGVLSDPVALTLRFLRAAVVVPIIEELFWRGWLMRWLIRSDFRSIPLGAYAPGAFWITAALFASEHGPFWDVGLAAGVVYNWWMVRTGTLGDLILAHGVTNACLSAYVIGYGKWEYWM